MTDSIIDASILFTSLDMIGSYTVIAAQTNRGCNPATIFTFLGWVKYNPSRGSRGGPYSQI